MGEDDTFPLGLPAPRKASAPPGLQREPIQYFGRQTSWPRGQQTSGIGASRGGVGDALIVPPISLLLAGGRPASWAS